MTSCVKRCTEASTAAQGFLDDAVPALPLCGVRRRRREREKGESEGESEREREKGERIGFLILFQFLFHSVVSISYFWTRFRVNLQFNRFV